MHGAWGIPQPSQAVALHCVDKEVDGLSFGRVYCNTLGARNYPDGGSAGLVEEKPRPLT